LQGHWRGGISPEQFAFWKAKDRGAFSLNDRFLLAYRYCLNGSVERAETLVVASAAAIKKDWFVDWLSGKIGKRFRISSSALNLMLKPRGLSG